jgi:hypothetical protein
VDTDATCRASAGLGKASPAKLQTKALRNEARAKADAQAEADAAEEKARTEAVRAVSEPTLIDNGDEVIVKGLLGSSDLLASRYYRTDAACQTGLAAEKAEDKARKDAADAEAHKLDKYR